MRNLLAFLGAALVVFLGLGWYLDWYKIQSTPAAGGRHNINIDLNTKKIGEDVNQGISKGEKKLKEVLKNDAVTQEAVQQEAENTPHDDPVQKPGEIKKDSPSELKVPWLPRYVPSTTGPEKKPK